MKSYDSKYDGLCKKCEQLEEAGNKIGNKHDSMKNHRKYIQQLINDKETRERLEKEELERKKREKEEQKRIEEKIEYLNKKNKRQLNYKKTSRSV